MRVRDWGGDERRLYARASDSRISQPKTREWELLPGESLPLARLFRDLAGRRDSRQILRVPPVQDGIPILRERILTKASRTCSCCGCRAEYLMPNFLISGPQTFSP